jgi:hypothetical protein
VAFVFTQGREYISFEDVAPIFDVLRPDLVPAEFRGKTSSEREALWPAWVT